MIVPMKKVFVIARSKDSSGAVRALSSIGVVHVVHQQPPAGTDISSLRDDIELLNKSINILSLEISAEGARKKSSLPRDWKTTAGHIIDLWKRCDHLEEYFKDLKAKIIEYEEWGDFDPEKIRALAGKNIHVRLYKVPASEVNRFPEGVIVRRISEVRGLCYCAAISKELVDMAFKEVQLPRMTLEAMRARNKENLYTIKNIKLEIKALTHYFKSFLAVRKAFEKELELHEAVRGMGQTGELVYLAGFVPYDAVDKLIDKARIERWGVSVTDPSEDEDVPTLIRNPRWVSIISPVFKIIEVVPGYKELDISFWFLIFFSVFFGMLIGDAGYGLVFIILTFLAQMKWGKRFKNKSVFILFYALSLFAVAWGVLSGTFFGQAWLPKFVKPLVPALRNDRNIQVLCFFLGALQLSVAHSWRAVLKLPSLKALADIGWVVILWGGFFLARTLILGDAFPYFAKWLFMGGAALVVFFTAPRKNVFKALGSGFGNLLLNLINSFTDIVSYVRLFAVGLATVAIADAFNSMAMDVGFNGFFSSLATALILFLGHALNILLGPLAILVHGVRLNVLEFCSHLDIKWSGFAYRPLKTRSDQV